MMLLNETIFNSAVKEGRAHDDEHIRETAYSQLQTYLERPTRKDTYALINIWSYMVQSTQFKRLDIPWYQTALYTWLSLYIKTDSPLWSDLMLEHLVTVPALTPLLYIYWHRLPVQRIEKQNKTISVWASTCQALNMSVRQAIAALDHEYAPLELLALPAQLHQT